MKPFRTFLALLLFGIGFGYVEAAVVVDLRAILGPVRQATFHGQSDDGLFPLLTTEHLRAAGGDYAHIMAAEAGREAATMVMLAAAGLAIGRNFRQWLAGFMISFGVWDIFYYVFLRVLIGWPDSLMTWDILFLLPVPWVGPVIAPVIVSLSMIVAGGAILRREAGARPIAFRLGHWAMIFGGGLTVIIAFCWDWRNAASGGNPNPFNWPLFLLGEAIGLAGFAHAYRQQPQGEVCGKKAAHKRGSELYLGDR